MAEKFNMLEYHFGPYNSQSEVPIMAITDQHTSVQPSYVYEVIEADEFIVDHWPEESIPE